MADISEYLETLKTAIYGEDMRGAIIGAFTLLSKTNTNALEYIKENVLLSPNETYTIKATAIAQNSPVIITISGGGGNTTLIRADDKELIDQLTGYVVNATMTEAEITAEDILAGVKLTEGGTLTVKYYNKNCEDLLRRIGNAVSAVTYSNLRSNDSDYTANGIDSNLTVTSTQYEEGEI